MVFILYKPYFLSPYTNPTPKPNPLQQGWATSVLEGRCPAEFSSNPNQTHMNKLINVFKITRKLQTGVFD